MPASESHRDVSVRLQLADTPIPSLLFQLLQERFTGAVHLAQGDQRATLWLRGGLPVRSDRQQPSTRLGELVVAQGLASQADVEATVAGRGAGELIGKALVEHGVLSAPQVLPLVRMQCALRLVELFALSEGEVVLAPGPVDDDLWEVSTLEAIQHAVAQHYDVARIEDEMGVAWRQHLVGGPSLPRYLAEFGFSAGDLEFLQAFAGGSGGRPAELCGSGDGAVLRRAQALFTLWSCRMLQPAQPVGVRSTTWEQQLQAMEAKLVATTDPDLVLGLAPGADRQAIDQAWQGLHAQVEPANAPADAAPSLRERGILVVARLREVYEAALDRRRAMAEFAGVRLAREGKYRRAQDLLAEATTLGSLGVEGQIASAWCRAQQAGQGSAEVTRVCGVLERLVGAHPGVVDGHYYLGMALGMLGCTAGAVTAFERTLKLDPGRTDAARQLRALKAPERAQASQAGGKSTASMHGVPIAVDPHPLWTLQWRRMYLIARLFLLVMLAANIVLRLDVAF